MLALVHGRMKPAEKQAVMASFKQGELHLLVATTVIEVGVDVPNASLMIIENPERLGLAQLHQLRGRVGRGAVASHCVLLYKTPLSKTAQIRLQVLRDSNDGFVIAQKDLEIRGPGELLGTRQTGNAEFKVADLLRDQAMIPEVQRLARHIHERYPQQAKSLDRTLDAGDRTLLECVKGGSEKTAISGYPTFLPDAIHPTNSINYESIRRLDKRSVSGICLCCGGTSTAASSVNRQKSATSNTT